MAYFEGIKKPIPIAFGLGLLGGAALIITTELTSTGSAIFIPYAVLIIVTFAALRVLNWASFFKRFITSLLTFMVATIILYLFVGIYDAGTILEISAWGHIWRLGLMTAIGGILSLPVAYIANIDLRKTACVKPLFD